MRLSPRRILAPRPWLLPALALLCLLAVAALAQPRPEPTPTPALPRTATTPEGPDPCLAAVEDAPRDVLIPGEESRASSLFVAVNRTVDADRQDVLRALALARVLDERPSFRDLVSYREERVEVCVFDGRAHVGARDALRALALGQRLEGGETARILGETRVVAVFRTVAEQNVSLDEDAVLAALALAREGGEVRLEDVADLQRSTRTTRTVEVTTRLDDEDALVELALRRDRASADEP